MITIYKITNTHNNKCYIGSTNNFLHRKGQHLSELRKNKHHCINLQKDFNKFGENSFIFTILESVAEEYRDISEEWYITKNTDTVYNTMLIPNILPKESYKKMADTKRTWKLSDLKCALRYLIENRNEVRKHIINNFNITESIFVHTVITQVANQDYLDKEALELIKIYKERKLEHNKKAGIKLINPEGKILEITNGIDNFCNEYKLDRTAIYKLRTNKIEQYNGWRVCQI